jgi:hypothetical protein
MNRSDFLFILQINLTIIIGASGKCPDNAGFTDFNTSQSDTIPDDQTLFNGRVWRNLYSMVEEDQFLFSKEFLPGSVTMRGRTHSDVMIMYDIYRDEILIPHKPAGILQLNKEMVDSFSILFQNKRYQFIRIQDSIMTELNGYCNVMYKGKTSLYVRYIKKIEKLATEGKNDKFYQVTRIYLIKDGLIHTISGKNDLINVFNDDKKVIKNFIKENHIKISQEYPASLIPVLRFTDTLRK